MSIISKKMDQETVLEGKGISSGIAIGTLYFLDQKEREIQNFMIPPEKIEEEVKRYRKAVEGAREHLKFLQKDLEIEKNHPSLLILDSQIEILNDPLVTVEIEQKIRSFKKNGEALLSELLKSYEERFQSVENPFFLDRFKDLQEIAHRIFHFLCEKKNFFPIFPPHSIICTQRLTPTEIADFKTESICAFLTTKGEKASHAAIIAKAKGIPFVSHIQIETLKKAKNHLIILDGTKGHVILNPSEQTLKYYESLREEMKKNTEGASWISSQKTKTSDGHFIRLYANLDSVEEVDTIEKFGGEGVGLFRTEYLLNRKNRLPSEEEQYEIYFRLLSNIHKKTVTIRTFDFEGDKKNFLSSYVGPSFDENLIKLLKKKLFKEQLRAILRATTAGHGRILFPMISTLKQLKEMKKILEEARNELQLFHPLEIGCMIEVPSAAIMVNDFIDECDFLAIGTNDLTHYTLGIDRLSSHETNPFESLDPSVIRLIHLISSEAKDSSISVSVCGEIASNPVFVPLLIGLGIQELSVSPRFLPLVKKVIHNISMINAIKIADQIRYLKNSEDILTFLEKISFEKEKACCSH